MRRSSRVGGLETRRSVVEGPCNKKKQQVIHTFEVAVIGQILTAVH